MKSFKIIFTLFLILNYNLILGQDIKNPILNQKEYFSIEDALKNPENVFRLNLSNQKVSIPTTVWSKFINLEYLSLKNDHLVDIPKEIFELKNLKILDLSGNDFKILSNDFIKLENLEELFLNDEKNMDLPKTLNLLGKLPKLKTLHLENDNLNSLPSEILLIKNLESLYLNHNKFNQIPKKIDGLPHLQYLDLNDNKIKLQNQDVKNLNFGLKINF